MDWLKEHLISRMNEEGVTSYQIKEPALIQETDQLQDNKNKQPQELVSGESPMECSGIK